MNRKNNSQRNWHRLGDSLLQKTRVFDLRIQRMRSPDGSYEDDFYYIASPDWVNVIPITREKEVIFVEQFRHGIRAQSLETPGGIVDHPDDDPLQTAIKELSEETGYVCDELVHLGSIHPNPAMLTNRCHVYLAENIRQESVQRLEPSEDIVLKTIPLSEVSHLIEQGNITHSLVISAFHLLRLVRPEIFQ